MQAQECHSEHGNVRKQLSGVGFCLPRSFKNVLLILSAMLG